MWITCKPCYRYSNNNNNNNNNNTICCWNKRLLALILLACLGGSRKSVVIALALPPGFRDEGVVSETQTVGFNFVPSILQSTNSNSNSNSNSNPEWILLTTRKKGQIVAVLDPDRGDDHSQTMVILDIQDKVCSEGERGVFQVLPHPNFDQNQFVYVFFTYDKHGGCKFSATDGPVNAVARYKLEDTTNTTSDHSNSNSNSKLEMVDETIIFMTNPLPSKVHNGGDMKFGNDGYLYVTLGNGGMSNEHGNAQKANTLLGSIVRITDSGRIPADNPFTEPTDSPCGRDGTILSDDGGRCSELWAIGFRNPFRFALDPGNTTNDSTETNFYVNDVGGSSFEEINRVNGNASSGGLNYGYRDREGPCKRMTTSGNCTPQPEYADPLYWYEHVNRTDACITGGAFVPHGIWPSSYDGKYLFSDFVFRTISVLRHDPSQECSSCNPPTPGFSGDLFFDLTDTGQPLQLTFGPYKDSQALYYSLWAPEEEFNIRRIVYEGRNSGDSSNNYQNEGIEEIDDSREEEKEEQGHYEKGQDQTTPNWSNNDNNIANIDEDSSNKLKDNRDENSAPDAKFQIEGADVKKGQNYAIDQVIVFDASGSTDPDGDAMSYSWNFGDGTGSTKAMQTHAYSKAGEYRVKLTVQDTYGVIDKTSRLITVGRLPEPSIIIPWESLTFAVGDVMTLFGVAKDGDGNYLTDSDLTWEVQQVHNTHYHPFLDPTVGNLIKSPPAPSPEDFQAAKNSFLRVLLTATDPKTNLKGTIIRDVMPKTKALYFGTDPPGLELTLDGFDIKTSENGDPLEVITWIHHNFTIDVRDQEEMVFKSWSDGATERNSRHVIQEGKDGGSGNNDGRTDASRSTSANIKTARFARSETGEG